MIRNIARFMGFGFGFGDGGVGVWIVWGWGGLWRGDGEGGIVNDLWRVGVGVLFIGGDGDGDVVYGEDG